MTVKRRALQKYNRLHVVVRGAVQGVGFRPFVYRLAAELSLTGWVNNNADGVTIEVEGLPDNLETFLTRIRSDAPPQARILKMESTTMTVQGNPDFRIIPSGNSGAKSTLILPDIATCPQCLEDIFDPQNRRYLYPFTNCTNCGPRFTIINALPYDRPNTTMSEFEMCDACRAEYENPRDRRFHAQPNACPKCGPHIELWDRRGMLITSHNDALKATVESIRRGGIVAVKGLGGFQLLVDACNTSAVDLLRKRKHRPAKPFALMFPSLDMVRVYCDVSPLEAQLLTSPEAPIVLLRKRTRKLTMPDNIAPDNAYLGVMLPYTPLHHILLRELNIPIVATSGNLSDEPICIDEHCALEQLGAIADLFLVHNRPITRHADDSIVRVMADRELMLRRARGFAPLPVQVDTPLPRVMAVGGHLKNTTAIAINNAIFISQHVGDLGTLQSYQAFRSTIDSFQMLYDFTPDVTACDLHPDYQSTQYATSQKQPHIPVQHHYAHVLSCMAEHRLSAPVLGVTWDGTGYGIDGTVWGGEFLEANGKSFTRIGHLRQFYLPGGEKAVKEARRSAFGLLYSLMGEEALKEQSLIRMFSTNELNTLSTMIERNINSPLTSSGGRLFDAVSALLGLCEVSAYEGQAAMLLEHAIGDTTTDAIYGFDVSDEPPHIVDWELVAKNILRDVAKDIPASVISAKFHNTVVEMITAVVCLVQQPRIVLTGGCFQNRYLTERTIKRLQTEGFEVYWHRQIPPNDGGISTGQIIAASYSDKECDYVSGNTGQDSGNLQR